MKWPPPAELIPVADYEAAMSRARMLARVLLGALLLWGAVAVYFAPLVWRAVRGGE